MKVKQLVKIVEAVDDRLPSDMYDLDNMHHYSKNQDEVVSIADMDVVHFIRAFNHQAHMLNNQVTSDDLIKQNRDLISANKTLGRLHNTWKVKAMNMVEKSTHTELEMENQRLVQQLEHDETVVSKEVYQAMKERADLNSYEAYKYKKLAEDNFISSVNDSEDKDTWKKKYDDLKKKSEYDGLNVEGVRTVWQEKYEELRKTYAVLLEDYNTDTGRGIWKEKYEQELNNSEYWKNTYYNNQPKGCGYVFSEIPNDTDGQEFVDAMKKYFNKKTYKMRVRGQHIKPELKGTGATAYGQSRDESTHLRVYIDVK